MESKKHWWQEQPLLIGTVQCHLSDSDEYVLDEYISKSHFTTEQLLHLVANGFMGCYSEKLHGQKLDEYLKKSRAYGIREIVYHNTHCIEDTIAKTHPDWLQRQRDGSDMEAYGIDRLVCVNPNGAWHKNFIKELEALCTHDIDGVFLDGPVMREDGCYCETCRKDFMKRFGHPIEASTRLERQTMRVETVTRHMKEAHDTVKRINPEIALYLNNSALRADVTGNNTRKIYEYVDILGAEGGFHRALLGVGGLWQISSMAKHLEGIEGDTLAGKKPLVCFFNGNQSCLTYYMHTPAETLLSYAQSFANGSNVWYGVHFSASEFKDTASARTAVQMNRFILDHKDIYAPSKVCARVALMWSQCTANNYASSVTDSDFTKGRAAGYPERGDHLLALQSVFDMLVRNHIQFDIIDEVSLTNGTVYAYDSVILPEVACLSDECAEIIADYVEKGGNILGNFDVGLYNEDGTFAGRSKLEKVFGFKGVPTVYDAKEIGLAYMFKKHDDPVTDGLSFFRIPSPVLGAAWEVEDDVKVIMEGTPVMDSTYTDLPTEGRYPALTVHGYGKGKAYYISGNYGETAVIHRNIPDYHKLIRRFCDITARKTLVSDEAGLYETVLRRQTDRFILHVINLTGAMSRPLETVVPLYGVRFELTLDGFGVDIRDFKVSSVRGAKVTKCSQNGGTVTFTLDQVDGYEVIVIE